MSNGAKVLLREINTKTDLPFIYASWRKQLWNDQPRPEAQAKRFFRQATKNIGELLAKPNAQTIVAVLDDDHDLILGYVVKADDHLEWVYVKLDYRKKGIGKMLVGRFATISKPETKIGRAIAMDKKLIIKESYGKDGLLESELHTPIV